MTIAAEGEARMAAIAALIADWRPAALVVGVPFHPDGAAHENTSGRAASAASCRRASACRCTRSTSATRRPRPGAPAPVDLDAAAAAIILEQHLAGL